MTYLYEEDLMMDDSELELSDVMFTLVSSASLRDYDYYEEEEYDGL